MAGTRSLEIFLGAAFIPIHNWVKLGLSWPSGNEDGLEIPLPLFTFKLHQIWRSSFLFLLCHYTYTQQTFHTLSTVMAALLPAHCHFSQNSVMYMKNSRDFFSRVHHSAFFIPNFPLLSSACSWKTLLKVSSSDIYIFINFANLPPPNFSHSY